MGREVACPSCGTRFAIDEDYYNSLIKQVRDAEFESELAARVADAVKLAVAEANADSNKRSSDLERQIAELKAKLDSAGTEKDLAVEKVTSAKNSQIQTMAADLKAAESRLAEAKKAGEDKLATLRIQTESERKLAVQEAVSASERKIAGLESDLKLAQLEADQSRQSMRDLYEGQLRLKDEEIAFYRDFKARQSTKMIGESLEVHCMALFDQVRPIGFPRAYFEKDNKVSETGSKGDFIYRDYDADGNEIISVMLEMKNESDSAGRKHKNTDFLKELDKDRREKGCEYAILVTLLEPDSEVYNSGIVDMCHKYPNMYVVRPQFMIPMLTLLRNMALRSDGIRQELARVRAQNADVTHFEEELLAFQAAFGRNYRLASERFADAIGEIDKAIDHLNKIKQNLVSSERQLELANRKAEGLSMKKLTKNSPGLRQQLDSGLSG